MSTLTTEQITTILDAADAYNAAHDYENLYTLLEPVSDGHAITGAELGRVYHLLGEACLGQNALDAAMSYYEAAAPLTTGDWHDRSTRRIEELRRYDSAVDAEYEGVAGEDEASKALATAHDALMRADYDMAQQWFQHAYDGIQMSDEQVATAAIGLSDCAAQRGDAATAEGYLQVAESRDATRTQAIADRRHRLADIGGAAGLADDGVTMSELDDLNRAAIAAFAAGDYAASRMHCESAIASPAISGTDRGRFLRNMGIACIFLHDYDAARVALTESAEVGSSATRDGAKAILTRLDTNDEAWDIIADIDLEAD
jgi:hypothetical protein